MPNPWTWFSGFALSGLSAGGLLAAGAPPDFAHEILPVFREYCADCHSGKQRKGGFSLNSRETLIAGGENGPLLDQQGETGERLIRLLTSEDPDERMPPKGDRVPPEKIALIEAWMRAGAPWSAGVALGGDEYKAPLKPRQVALPAASAPNREHPIDRLLDAWLVERGLPLPDRVSDALFFRRVSLDLTGSLPEPEMLGKFLASPVDSRQKREKLVDLLLADEIGWADHWLSFWNDLLRNDYQGTGYIDGGRTQITAWLYDSLRRNKSVDQLARELISPPDAGSSGFMKGIIWRGKVNASQTPEIQFSQNVSQVFLGINMKCASCHDSFTDHWKLDQAYGLAAVFAEKPIEIYRCDVPTGRMAEASWPFPELGRIETDAPRSDRLRQLATLLTSPENGRFARNIVNRAWQKFFGRGLVDPVDSLDVKPWNEDLLDWLAFEFARSGYDLKSLVRLIVTSEAYQSVAAPSSGKAETAPHGLVVRRMTAEQFVDGIRAVTGNWPGAGAQAAGVDRTVFESGAPQPVLTPEWIWAEADPTQHQANERVNFTRTFSIRPGLARAMISLSCDNEFILKVNGKRVAKSSDWMTPVTMDIREFLRNGENEMLVEAKNLGAGNNPAGLILFLHLTDAVGHVTEIVSDTSWQARPLPDAASGDTAPPPGEKKTALTPVAPKPKPASVVAFSWQGAFGEKWAQALLTTSGATVPPIRASLMNSDPLQRSLGRPNREQIVSVRPEELSMLQALDLANGQEMDALMKECAAKLLASAKAESGEQLLRSMFLHALSREPEAAEKAVLLPMLDPPSDSAVNAQGLADALWILFMSPEFQLIR